MLSVKPLFSAKDIPTANHHFSLGQVVATVLLGLQDTLVAIENPAECQAAISNFVSGFVQIWMTSQVAPTP